MASITKFCGTVSQTTGGSYCTFSNLNNIKNSTASSYATSSGLIKSKNSSPNRPSTVTCTNFGFNLPTGAEVSKVTVTYRHRKNKSGNTVCNIPAPTISLVGVSGFSSKGAAPTTSMVTNTKSFTGAALTRSVVNSSSFGVKINYPTNTNTYEGTLSISYVTIKVEYKVPSYTLSIKKISGGYNGEGYNLEVSISNKNLTSYNPTLTLSAPTGFSFLKSEGQGVVTAVNARTLTWNPKLTSKVGTSTVNLQFNTNVTYPVGTETYTGTFTLVESLYSGTTNYTATIVPKPSSEGSETEPDAPAEIDEGSNFNYLKVIVDEEVPVSLPSINNSVVFGFPVDGDNEIIYLQQDSPIQYNDGTTEDDDLVWTWVTEYSNGDYTTTPVEGSATYEKFRFRTPGHYALIIYTARYTSQLLGAPKDGDYSSYDDDEPLTIIYFDVRPNESDLTMPYSATYTLTTEELNRLGDGYAYIVQAYVKQSTTDTYIRDWYKNNRLAVTNNGTNYSLPLDDVNRFESLEVEFTYDEQNPVTITVYGDYPESVDYGFDIGTIEYTEPCIIEKKVYNEREPNGVYPTPILPLIDDETGDASTLSLTKEGVSSPIILYDFPLDEGYGTAENLAIRGLQVRANVESSDDLVIMAKLHSPNGNTGQRSIVLTSTDAEDQEAHEIVIGGLGDLWGFTTLDMINLEDWEVELTVNNLLVNGDASIVFNDVNVTFFVESVEHQEITVKIENEDLAYYGAFIEAIDIPEGLSTDTSFLTIDGTDTNDAYRQNIKEKTITIEFNLSNCDLKTSTDMLRQLSKLFVNEKDKYNRPIPKRVTFSHYPTDYFEYIMEEPFDVKTEISDYNVKAKLTIPAGTSYSLEDTVTSIVGNANGLAAVNPIIRFRPSDTNIEIRETVTGQIFNMGYGGDWTNKLVEINCEDRVVYLYDDDEDTTPIDLSGYVDHNTDWFRLYGEYSFEGLNCTILSVTFNERW